MPQDVCPKICRRRSPVLVFYAACPAAGEYSLALRQCATDTDGFGWRQVFTPVTRGDFPGIVQLKVESINICLDAGQGTTVLAYGCRFGIKISFFLSKGGSNSYTTPGCYDPAVMYDVSQLVTTIHVADAAALSVSMLGCLGYDGENPNQVWSISGSHLVWESAHASNCLHAEEERGFKTCVYCMVWLNMLQESWMFCHGA